MAAHTPSAPTPRRGEVMRRRHPRRLHNVPTTSTGTVFPAPVNAPSVTASSARKSSAPLFHRVRSGGGGCRGIGAHGPHQRRAERKQRGDERRHRRHAQRHGHRRRVPRATRFPRAHPLTHQRGARQPEPLDDGERHRLEFCPFKPSGGGVLLPAPRRHATCCDARREHHPVGRERESHANHSGNLGQIRRRPFERDAARSPQRARTCNAAAKAEATEAPAAAPATPRRGKGPQPNISAGSRAAASATDTIVTRRATCVFRVLERRLRGRWRRLRRLSQRGARGGARGRRARTPGCRVRCRFPRRTARGRTGRRGGGGGRSRRRPTGPGPRRGRRRRRRRRPRGRDAGLESVATAVHAS